MDLLGVSRVRFTAQYLIFPNAKRGFSTILEGSRRCVLQWCSGRFSEVSETNPEFLEFAEFVEFVEFLADAGTPPRAVKASL